MSRLSPAADVYMGGTGVHSECGIRHSLCTCWDDVDPDWEEEDDE